MRRDASSDALRQLSTNSCGRKLRVYETLDASVYGLSVRRDALFDALLKLSTHVCGLKLLV